MALIKGKQLTANTISLDKLATTTAGNMLVANSSGQITSLAMSGDATISDAGVLTIGANSIEGSMLNANVISAQTELTSGLASTDELMVSDAGVLKRMDVSVLQTYMQSNLTFTTALTQENVEDYVGAMVSGNTETFITVSYDDTDGTLDFVVPVLDEDNMASDSALHLATQQSIKAYVDSQVTSSALDIDSYTALGSTGIAQSDHFVFSDAGTEKKITFSNLEDAIFGSVSGDATIAAGGALSLASAAITGQTAETTIADDDLILISDTSASGALRKMTKANFVSGISGSSFSTTDITGQTDHGSGASSNDYLVMYDGSTASLNKISVLDFFSPSFTVVPEFNKLTIGDFQLDYSGGTSTQYLRLKMLQNENSNEPMFLIENQTTSATGGALALGIREANSNVVSDGDTLGQIRFQETQSNGAIKLWAEILGKVSNHTNNYGQLRLTVSDGASTSPALDLVGGSGGTTVDVLDHDGTDSGLKLGGALVTSTAAELNLLDGGTSVGSSITIADTDGFIINDGGVMKTIPASDLSTYVGGGGSSTLSGLSDTTISSPSAGHVLVYDGTDSFDNVAVSGDATLASDGALSLSVTAVTGQTTLSSIADDNFFLLGKNTQGLRKATFFTLKNDLSDYLFANAVLGADLDVATYQVKTTTANGNVALLSNGTGVVEIKGNTDSSGTNPGAIKLNCEQNSHGITIKSPAHASAATYTLTLPTTDGNANEFLQTDGSGVLSWAAGSGYSTNIAAANSTATLTYSSSYNEVLYVSTPASANITLTLPNITANSISDGYKVNIKNMSGTYSVTVSPDGTGTADVIDASGVTHVLSTQYENITLMADSTNNIWYRV